MRFSVLNYKAAKKSICIEEKVIIWINFNPGLVLAGFQTILPGFKQVNWTWARRPIENHHLVNCLVVFSNHFNPNNSLLILLNFTPIHVYPALKTDYYGAFSTSTSNFSGPDTVNYNWYKLLKHFDMYLYSSYLV